MKEKTAPTQTQNERIRQAMRRRQEHEKQELRQAILTAAGQLFLEQGFAPWMTYVSGAYRRFLFHHSVQLSDLMAAQRGSMPGNLFHFGALQQPSGQSGNALPE